MKWRVVLEADSETGEWAVWCPELPGCVSCGETEEEALDNILKAIELYLEPSDLKEFVQRRKQQEIIELFGNFPCDEDYDYKKVRK